MVGSVVLVGGDGNVERNYSSIIILRMIVLMWCRKMCVCLIRLMIRLCMLGSWYDGNLRMSGCLL